MSRFGKSFRLGGGARLNLSSRGIGGSVGGKGLRFGAGPRGLRVTAGIPGTGLRISRSLGRHKSRGSSADEGLLLGIILFILICVAIAYWEIALIVLAFVVICAIAISASRQKEAELEQIAEQETEQLRQTADDHAAERILGAMRNREPLPNLASPVPVAPDEACCHISEASLYFYNVKTASIDRMDDGHLILTSKRLIFLGTTKNVSTSINKILAIKQMATKGFEVHSSTRQRVEVYAVELPREFMAYLFAVFTDQDITPPIDVDYARQLAAGYIPGT